jgi:hypothetical protein
VITDQPDDLSGACAGDINATFTVSVTSALDPITYQWRLDGDDIPGATSSSYVIPVVATADEGTYDCVVSGCVAIVSDPAVLALNEPTITTQPQDYFALLGEPAAFYVVATPFLGSLSYQWFFEGNPIGPDDDILAIGPVTPADYGNYSCVITDSCGVATTQTARLLPPGKENNHQLAELGLAIIDHPQSLELCDGSQAVFSVNASVNGLPGAATYVWRFNGFPIAPPETNSTLVLNSVTPAENGIYDVVVSLGPKSKASLPASLNVIDIPTIITEPSPGNQSLPPGSDVSYTVIVAPGGTIAYQWQKKPTTPFAPFANIPNANGPSHNMDDITPSDAGTYRCRISNECGFRFSNSCRLIVL